MRALRRVHNRVRRRGRHPGREGALDPSPPSCFCILRSRAVPGVFYISLPRHPPSQPLSHLPLEPGNDTLCLHVTYTPEAAEEALLGTLSLHCSVSGVVLKAELSLSGKAVRPVLKFKAIKGAAFKLLAQVPKLGPIASRPLGRGLKVPLVSRPQDLGPSQGGSGQKMGCLDPDVLACVPISGNRSAKPTQMPASWPHQA
eukprot:gene21533-28523_t